MRAGLPSCIQWPNHCYGENFEYTVLDGEKSGKRKFSECRPRIQPTGLCLLTLTRAAAVPPGAAHSVYMPVPCASTEASLEWDVTMLKSAMDGIGTNEDQIVRVLCNRENHLQLRIICSLTPLSAGRRLRGADRDHREDVRGGQGHLPAPSARRRALRGLQGRRHDAGQGPGEDGRGSAV